MTASALARKLRQSQTPSEDALWQHLRAHRLAGTKWKRQQPIGAYIIDFVCHECKIVVEADGGQHNDSQSDGERDRWLLARGFTVSRFWNNEIQHNLEGVLERILACVDLAGAVALSPIPLPSRERGSAQRLPLPSRERDSLQPPPLPLRQRDSVQRPPPPSAKRSTTSLPPGGGGTEGEGR